LEFDRYPIRGTFFGCCASAREAVVKKKVASRRMAILLFIFLFRKGLNPFRYHLAAHVIPAHAGI